MLQFTGVISKMPFKVFLIVLLFFPVVCRGQEDFEPRKGRQTVGWLEKVRISPGDLVMNAKLDPGKVSSTLYAESVKKMRKGKKLWVSFELTDQYGNSAKISREVLRSEKAKGADGKQREDQVISLGMCLGKMYFEDEVRLTDKRHDEYDIRVGRQALEGNVLIDPGAKLSSSPECGEKGKDLGTVEPISGGEGSEEGAGE